ncbi:sensor histidine kinase [Catellatospora tritici]|uniref:sensor histidine kinase n=1 Tax=Catellatospora tritici TaxID=2851566 RepID=UPI001C2DE57F|nr:nitrate- and nitrite sensing domain-containing protein [Catellatospora tritici]MBV1854234.1 nitrate- and nitrite sensing domain-containing protein [Catellatospora tritici]
MTGTSGSTPPWAPPYARETEPALPARRRVKPLRSIRYRLLLPIAVATAALAVLGGIQTRTAMRSIDDARQSVVLTDALTATVRLGHQLEQEVAETEALLQRGGKAGEQLLVAQRRRTDEAVQRYGDAAAKVMQTTPALRDLLAEAGADLSALPQLRDRAQQPAALNAESKDGETSPEEIYDDLTHAMVAVGEALAAEPKDADLNALARTVSVLNALEHHRSEARGLLREAFGRNEFEPGQLAELAELHGAQIEREAQLEPIAGASLHARYLKVVSGEDVDKAEQLLEAALRGDTDPAALRVDPDTWHIAQTNALRRLYLFELEVVTDLDDRAAMLQTTAQRRAWLVGSGTVAAIIVSLAFAVFLAVRTSRGLRKLSRAALTVATDELPTAIAEVAAAPSAETVRRLTKTATTRVDTQLSGPADEIGEVGAALGALHQQALRLAADQAMLRNDVSAMFVNLSRRGQTLVQRQLHLIDEFERDETDPQSLARLFALDHLAARMRRNEENLLVLAGGEPSRRFVRSELLIDVVHAAAAEIDQYTRIETQAIADLSVVAHAVGDVVHLLAELLENATDFSPPNSRVLVSSRRGVDGLTLSVFDSGIGMPPQQLDEINERLTRPSTLTSDLTRTMGLLVVARIAARRGISVQLRSSPGGGTVALVLLPTTLLAPPPVAAERLTVSAPGPALPDGEMLRTRRGGVEPSRDPSPTVPSPTLDSPTVPSPIITVTAVPPTPSVPSSAVHFPVRPGGTEAATQVIPAVVAAPPAHHERELLPSGLPRRRPGDVLAPDGGTVARPRVDALDPEVVRTRLSGLATGIAAAHRELALEQQASSPAKKESTS